MLAHELRRRIRIGAPTLAVGRRAKSSHKTGIIKASPFGRGGGVADGEGKGCVKPPLTRYRGSSPQGRAYGCARAALGVQALHEAFLIQRRNCGMFFRLAVGRRLGAAVFSISDVHHGSALPPQMRRLS